MAVSRSDKDDLSICPEIKFEDVSVGKQLGTGAFGSVHLGTWRHSANSEKTVALKKVFVLEKEAEILSKLRHRNIIEFYGICSSKSDFYIVTEYAENGSLYDHLHNEHASDMDFTNILKWATQICSALVYLHYQAVTTIIHRDLKSKNVVLDSKLQCKICDFGTSKDLTHSCTAPTWGGTAAWMSPEMINQNEGITIATDTWSYGVVLWELLSHEVPYKDFTEFQIYTLITQQGITLVIPESCPYQLAEIMHGCWQMNPKERFSMKVIQTKLEIMGQSSTVQNECQYFLKQENWQKQISEQKKRLEDMKKCLEKQKEMLNAREKAIRKRYQENAIRLVTDKAPEDMGVWNENQVVQWIYGILNRTLSEKDLGVVKSCIFRHRITGSRLLGMSQNDLEHIGLYKLGSRIEVSRELHIRRKENKRLMNFPTLQEAQMIQKALEKEQNGSLSTDDHDLVLILGFSSRRSENVTRFKFFLDSDWVDVDETTNLSTYLIIKSVCFSLFDHETNKPINEPACFKSCASIVSMDWLSKDKDVQKVKVLANIHFADGVREPRSTEMMAVVTHMDSTSIVSERTVRLKITDRRKGSTSSLSSTSSPSLRGVWHKKASETRNVLTESEIVSILTPPSSAEPKMEPVDFKPLGYSQSLNVGGKTKPKWARSSKPKRNW